MAPLTALILIYSTVAIELTLIWNGITDIYTVASTGMIIPFIAGICLLLNILYTLCKEKLVTVSYCAQ